VGAKEYASAKIRTLIVDDEQLALSNLRVLLRRDLKVEIVGECTSGVEALAQLRKAKPDLAFLDVQMPECGGFDILEQLGRDVPPAVVFVTAYDQYALKAFEAGALDYLLKPFDDDRFALALSRAKERIAQNRILPGKLDRLIIKTGGEVLFLRTAEVDWIEAADYYSCLHVGPRTLLLRRSMAELEQELDPDGFCRTHRSSIVKLDRVRSLKLNADGEYEVLLNNGAKLRLSRRYRKQLQSRLGIRDTAGS
jgi:two-component system, LytTR family, response regulator